MKIKEVTLEMVQRIPAFKLQLEDVAKNKKVFKKITQFTSKAKLVQHFDTGIKLFQLDKGKETEFFGVDEEQELIAYYLRYEIQDVDFLDTSWVTQVMVWRGHLSSNKSEGIAKRIFYDFVLAKFGTAITDGEQTADGERFWKQRIIEAFSNEKLKVYILDFHQKQCKRLLKDQYIKLLNTKNDPWGNSAWHKGIRLAISDFDLVQE
jgi:hypothetical protein